MRTDSQAAPPWQADLDEATRIARSYSQPPGRSAARSRQRRADVLLFAELFLHVGVMYWLVYGPWPPWGRLALLVPWSLYSALAVDNILHYQNHWPVFRSESVNRVLRLVYSLLLLSPLEVRYTHWEHHKYNDIEIDQETWIRSMVERSRRPWVSVLRYILAEGLSSLKSLVPWGPLPEHMARLRTRRPSHYREIRAMRWLNLVILIALAAASPLRTVLLFVPAVLLVPSLTSVLMNITDHLPGQLTHPFRQATWLEPASLRERALAAINRRSGATHLSHHLFPQVHWTALTELQRALAPLYRRHGAPRSMLHCSILVGDWLAFGRLVGRIGEECSAFLREGRSRA